MKSKSILSALGLLGVACCIGCQSAKQPGTVSHASAQIPPRSMAQIREAATSIFGADGASERFSCPMKPQTKTIHETHIILASHPCLP